MHEIEEIRLEDIDINSVVIAFQGPWAMPKLMLNIDRTQKQLPYKLQKDITKSKFTS